MPSTAARLLAAAVDVVETRIPSAASVAHAAVSFGAPSTDTRQMRQLPTTGSSGYQHSVGISMPAERAASSIVAPAAAAIAFPSIVSVSIFSSPEGVLRLYITRDRC